MPLSSNPFCSKPAGGDYQKKNGARVKLRKADKLNHRSSPDPNFM